MSNKEKIFVIGSNGMLGQRLTLSLKENQNYDLICSSFEPESYIENVIYNQFDISNKEQVEEIINQFQPDFIINTAAYTNVDKSETEKEAAEKINVNGVEYIAKAANKIDAHVIHISSDYVFDGESGPYTETDTPNPLGFYAKTKLKGELKLLENCKKNSIIRTNVLYGPAKYGRPDFVKWVYNMLKSEQPINIVIDQINNPTFIDDIVNALVTMVENKIEGLFNIGGKEFLNRYEFTLRIADYFGLNKQLINPILTSELNQPAARPLKSGLYTAKAEKTFGYKPTDIEKSFELMKIELNL